MDIFPFYGSNTENNYQDFEYYKTLKKLLSAQIVGGDIHEHNTFGNPEKVTIKDFEDVCVKDGNLSFEIPASSVMHVVVTLK